MRPAQKGFTLIELIVAIAIVAIISAVGFVSYSQSQKLARDSKRKQDLQELAKALQLYYSDNNFYPKSAPLPAGCAVNPTPPSFFYCFSNNSTSPWIPVLTSAYTSGLPKDPLKNDGEPNNGTNYGYGYRTYTSCEAEGRYYVLYTRLENTADPSRLALNDKAICPSLGSLIGAAFNGNLYVITSY